MQIRVIKKFLALEAASAYLLFISAVISMIWANSPLSFIQEHFTHTFLFLINEGLMTLFFLMVGLELKRGFLQGQLNRPSQIVLPGVAALFGMLVPAGIYCAFNWSNPVLLKGWATPVATDIAFAVGVLSLFGKRVPFALKLFLLSLAIFDDLGAVMIIAFFFSHHLDYLVLFQASILVIILYWFNVLSIRAFTPYFLIGLVLWFAFLRAGVHPTITGFLLAMMLPVQDKKGAQRLAKLESRLHPWVAYLIMPLFALANAGLSFQDITWSSFSGTLVLGITAALFIGKQAGVMGATWLVVRTRLSSLPEGTDWLSLYGVAVLCGIGFTMSLFLGTLSFQHENIYLAELRLGVIIGSLLSGLLGASVLFGAFARNKIS